MYVSVIIPALNEEPRIAAVIASARRAGADEIIVVDGGSTDETRLRADSADIVLTSDAGRARQQNMGAAASCGDVLLFLHADCLLPDRAIDVIRELMGKNPRAVAGCFRQRIDAEGALYRWIEWGNGLRARWFHMAYGDQGIFVRRSLFDELGRFTEVRFMEDVLLMKRLRGRGQFIVIDDQLTVSARRWQRNGVIRQTLRNWFLLTLALCGVSPDSLVRFYPNTR